MLAQGADSNASDKTQASVLFYTMAVKENMSVISLLLGKGKNVSESLKSDLRNTELSDHTCRPGRTLQDRRHFVRGQPQLAGSVDNILQIHPVPVLLFGIAEACDV